MEKNIIVQFVGFETTVAPDEFILNWEPYAKQFASKKVEVTLEHQAGSTHRFKYLSQHKWPDIDFQFVFMKGRHSEHFPECHVKVIQAGGYLPVQIERAHDIETNDVKLTVFIRNAETDISPYQQLASQYGCLNIYQAYYESCLYAYILEFFVEEANISAVINAMKDRTANVQTGIYKECLVLNN